MSLNAGALVHNVTIQSLTAGTDSSGAPETTTATLTTAWMSRETERAGEEFKADQLSASIVTLWTLRYLASMDPDLVDVPTSRRLVYQGRVYDIQAAETIDRKNGIMLRTLAASRVAA